MNASAIRSSTMAQDSLVQRMELSKLLDSISSLAAVATSAVWSTSTGTLPGPTPSAGLPERYAARTTALPPVATITLVRGSVISASIRGIVGSVTTCTTPVGAPAASAAAPSARDASAHTRLAIGCGLTTTALRVIRLSRILKYTVATGLVDGVSASTTPAGRGTSTILVPSSIRGVTKSAPA